MESPTVPPAVLRQKAVQYREMVRGISDPRTIEALETLADEYEAVADGVESESGSL